MLPIKASSAGCSVGDKTYHNTCIPAVPVTAIATGFREFGDCDVFTDHDTNSCAEVTSSDTPVDFVLKANISLSENSNGVRITLRNGDCDDSKQVISSVYIY